ncbi:MAG: hypothetical protein DHS20C15_27230 [Planctomycetota bacterium]|nr:MAG: hypothetical protein DHS20C15_27230 [Planctomycetota bacterium]
MLCFLATLVPLLRGALFASIFGATACALQAEQAMQDSAPAGAGVPPASMAAINAVDLAQHVRVLASDSYQGRFPGTTGEARTLAYLSAGFARAGLEAPYAGSYLQGVPLASLLVEARSSLAVTSVDGGRRVDFAFPDDVLLGGLAAGGHDNLHDSPIVFVGYGIHAPERNWDDYADVNVSGRTVLALWGEPAAFGDGGSHHGTLFGKRQAAAAQGAAGFLVIPQPSADSLPWSVYADHARQPSHAIAGEPTPLGRLLRGTLREERARELLALADLDLDSLRDEAGVDSHASYELPLRAHFDVHAVAEPVFTHNVLGVLRGSEHPEECVIYTAHWDHVGQREDIGGDHIFNGAVDNATGTSALLELARVFGALDTPPARSVVFLATTAEEQGLLGAHYHAENPLFPLGQTVAVINMDALFPFGETKGLTVVGAGRSELDAYLQAAAQSVGRVAYPDPMPEQGAFYRSDHYPFASRGVPASFAVGGPAQDPEVNETVDIQRWVEYVGQHYHRPTDEYDASTWDMAGIVQDVRGFFHAGWQLANTRHFPNWLPESEFRALRDAQRARFSAAGNPSR